MFLRNEFTYPVLHCPKGRDLAILDYPFDLQVTTTMLQVEWDVSVFQVFPIIKVVQLLLQNFVPFNFKITNSSNSGR